MLSVMLLLLLLSLLMLFVRSNEPIQCKWILKNGPFPFYWSSITIITKFWMRICFWFSYSEKESIGNSSGDNNTKTEWKRRNTQRKRVKEGWWFGLFIRTAMASHKSNVASHKNIARHVLLYSLHAFTVTFSFFFSFFFDVNQWNFHCFPSCLWRCYSSDFLLFCFLIYIFCAHNGFAFNNIGCYVTLCHSHSHAQHRCKRNSKSSKKNRIRPLFRFLLKSMLIMGILSVRCHHRISIIFWYFGHVDGLNVWQRRCALYSNK